MVISQKGPNEIRTALLQTVYRFFVVLFSLVGLAGADIGGVEAISSISLLHKWRKYYDNEKKMDLAGIANADLGSKETNSNTPPAKWNPPRTDIKSGTLLVLKTLTTCLLL